MADGLAQLAAELAALQHLLRGRAALGDGVQLALVLDARLQAQHLATRGVFHQPQVFGQRHLHRGSHFGSAGGTATALLEPADGGGGVAGAAVHRARHPVAPPDFIDHRAADADRGVGLERGALVGVVAARGLDQAHHAGLDQVVDFDAGRQACGKVVGDAPHQVRVLGDHLVGGRALDLPVLGCAFHAATPRCLRMRSRKNSPPPRAPPGWTGRPSPPAAGAAPTGAASHPAARSPGSSARHRRGISRRRGSASRTARGPRWGRAPCWPPPGCGPRRVRATAP
ncbi:hypothetical protein G6F35_013828 [Rhizopus arrhizus]|nr:hypothetical protein G6F35_013828 [Rhizopus arrhizus]